MTLICLFKKNKQKNKQTTIQIRGEEVQDNNVFKKKTQKTPTLRFAMQSGKPLVSLFAARCLMVIFEDT